jgi:membrane protein YdbS with pleckstrin-like domain
MTLLADPCMPWRAARLPLRLALVALSRRELGQDEAIVLELRSHRGELVLPTLLLFACAVGAVVLLGEAHALPLTVRRVLAGVLLVAGLSVALVRWIKWRSRAVVLTSQRFLVINGLLAKTTEQVRLSRVVEVHRRQGLLDRLMRRGSIILEVDDGPSLVVDALRRPEALQRLILRQLRSEEDLPRYGQLVGPERQVEPLARRPGREVWIVAEDDPTPPSGTPAVSGSRAALLLARLDELDRLELSGALSADEADRRRRQLTERI